MGDIMPKTTKLVNVESPKDSHQMKPLDLNDVEMVFGTPNSPKSDIKPDVHVANEMNKDSQPEFNNNGTRHEADASHPMQPLLKPDGYIQKPPLAGPEIDDQDDERPSDATPYSETDDELLHIHSLKPKRNEEGTLEKDDNGHHHGTHDDGVATEDGKWPWHSTDETDYPYEGVNGLSNRLGIDDRPISPFAQVSLPDVNTYQQKKNLAQGMMDLALLSANANQLRNVLEFSDRYPYFYFSFIFIILSIILQIAVGIGLIMNSRYDVKDEKDICQADKINNMTVLGVFLITIVNVFITSFSVTTLTQGINGTFVQNSG